MVRVFDSLRRPVGDLLNAFNVKEHQKMNAVSTFTFALPEDDPKNRLCRQGNTVSWDDGQLYKIMPMKTESDGLGFITYECEHVIATLIDSVMFGHHVFGGLGVANNTTATIQWLLNRQTMRFDPWVGTWVNDNSKIRSWNLGVCEINRNFEYGWEQENLLYALWSIGTPFTEDWMFEYDTSIFPYRLNLRRLSNDIRDSIPVMFKKNLTKVIHESDPTTVCNRLYPLGYGEGINQLNIRAVNGGVPFIQSPPAVVASHGGIIERVWIDRRYTDARSLLDAATAMLRGLETPYEQWEIEYANVEVRR